jgi:hypothetical protein
MGMNPVKIQRPHCLGLLFCLFVSIGTCLGQSFTVSGYVTDAETGERLYGAAIQEQQSSSGCVTNPYGFFSLTLSSGQRELNVSYVGYQKQIYRLRLAADTVLHIALKSDNTLEEVTVRARQADSPEAVSGMK